MKEVIHSPSKEMQLLGAYLKKLRIESGFSLREAARQAHITPSYLSKIEVGTFFSTLSVRTLVGLAQTYATPLIVLLENAHLIEKDAYKLPLLPQYLRLKYQLSNQAIRDMEMALNIVAQKYGKSGLPLAGKS